MRRQWEAHGLPNPPFRVVTNLEEAYSAFDELKPPLVMKPTNSGGAGRGVSVIRTIGDLEWAYQFAGPFCSEKDSLIVEQFVAGTEITVESISYAGEVHVLTMSDKVKPPLRTRVATSLNYPAAITPTARNEIATLTTQAVKALGIQDGPSHAEVILNSDGVTLLELAARGGGGHIFSTIVEAVTGVDMVRETARILVGEEPDLSAKRERGCVYRFFAPEYGTIREIRGMEAASVLPGVLDIEVTRKPGDVLGGLVNSIERSGFAVVAGRDRDEAVRRADEVSKTVVFDLDVVGASS
jgi:biotin carboxylase